MIVKIIVTGSGFISKPEAEISCYQLIARKNVYTLETKENLSLVNPTAFLVKNYI